MLELFVKGGWVMYPILAASVLALAVSLERAVHFLRIRNDDDALFVRVRKLLAGGRTEECLAACKSARGPVAASLSVCLRNLHKGAERTEALIEHEGSDLLAGLEKHLRILSVVAQIAPLLGLLGTVTGMIQAFMSVETTGGRASVTALAGGIWEALLTTAFGLCVAIPAMLAYHCFEGQVDDYERKIHRCVHEVLDFSREAEKA
jgi:biopolymer transport protein ExbB